MDACSVLDDYDILKSKLHDKWQELMELGEDVEGLKMTVAKSETEVRLQRRSQEKDKNESGTRRAHCLGGPLRQDLATQATPVGAHKGDGAVGAIVEW